MMKVLIMYHPDFVSKGKFERKISRIFSKSNDYQVFYFVDHNGLISDLLSDKELIQLDADVLANPFSVGLTHVVIFDSESKPIFSSPYDVLSSKIPVRYIKDKITFVSNKDKGDFLTRILDVEHYGGTPTQLEVMATAKKL